MSVAPNPLIRDVMDDPFRLPAVIPALIYGDPWAALDWLEKAFGFQRSMVITDKDGKLAHSEMHCGDGLLYVGSEWADYTVSPTSVSGKNTQIVHVHLKDGLDAHCERARAAGAVIVREPEHQFLSRKGYSLRRHARITHSRTRPSPRIIRYPRTRA